MEKKLWRKKQCAKCPWKTSTDPHEIPNGYCETKHQGLKQTIAREGDFSHNRAMACHESTGKEDEPYCIGWLFQQLGPGNNIGLRLKMMSYDLSGVELDGEQHESFEDTLPQDEEE